MLILGLTCRFGHADGATNQSTNPIVRFGKFSAIVEANGNYKLVNPAEFWNGVWKEGTNGWRVQLELYTNDDWWMNQPGVSNPPLCVEWGSIRKNSGGGYLRTPNGKFAKFELLDVHGTVVQPKPGAWTNLFLGAYGDWVYSNNPPSRAALSDDSLEARFPQTISTNGYPNMFGEVIGGIFSLTNEPPDSIYFLRLDDLYVITNEGDYTFIVQPVIYKMRISPHSYPPEEGILDRVDLPQVTMKVHLLPNYSPPPKRHWWFGW